MTWALSLLIASSFLTVIAASLRLSLAIWHLHVGSGRSQPLVLSAQSSCYVLTQVYSSELPLSGGAIIPFPCDPKMVDKHGQGDAEEHKLAYELERDRRVAFVRQSVHPMEENIQKL